VEQAQAEIAALIGAHGLWLLAPLAVIEGPVVTVTAGWLARLGAFDPAVALVVLVVADLLGDALLYAVGRSGTTGPLARLRHRLGLHEDRLRRLSRHFDHRGGATLVFGKLTHSVGAAILIAAGFARMPFLPFLAWNLLATLPKSAALFALGWVFGGAPDWLARAALLVTALVIALAALAVLRRRLSKGTPAE
jgi:membrane-associated protein